MVIGPFEDGSEPIRVHSIFILGLASMINAYRTIIGVCL